MVSFGTKGSNHFPVPSVTVVCARGPMLTMGDVTDAWLKFSSTVTRTPATGLPSVPLMKSKTFRVVAVGTPLSYLTKLGRLAMQRPPSRAGALWLLTYEHPSP